MIPEKFTKPYNPGETEQTIYALWEESGFFNPDNLPHNLPSGSTSEPRLTVGQGTQVWSCVMPPPNANAHLHVGHALDMTLKDIAARFERMRGKKTLLLPGADHAGFETQMVFEKKLAKDGKSRFGMDPAELYKQIYDFVMENKIFMENDLRRLGVSCDWSRNTFTLEPEIVKKVQDTFIKMHAEGLVYRGARIINWNPKYQTSLSDIETEFVERQDPFYYLQYGPFVIATVRPETKFGDKYVVMHPDDERYKEYAHGQKIELEWINGPVTATIIKDEAIDREFGTGAMTITPWHDPVDFEIAERHGLDKEQIIDFQGKLLPIAGEFAGMKTDEARPKIIDKMKAKGLLVKVEENYTHNIRICERTKVPIEPQIKEQWWVKMKPLAERVINAVEKENKIAFLPEYQKKILLHWMRNTIDWNISRQIVWGIPIPAWFRDGEVHVGHESPGEGWVKDSDTFDTWFSSGQWPLLTLGFPDGDDFKAYYPTNLMETGNDLVFKWVPRMIMFGLYLAGDIPFKTVYFHGMINDEHNQKMSKSKGNVLSPVEVADEFGADALRMALVVGNTPGNDMALSKDKIRAYKKFANKLWNIARYVMSAGGAEESESRGSPRREGQVRGFAAAPALQKYVDEFDALAADVTKDIEDYRIYLAAEKLYHYIWDRFASEILEESKNKPEYGATLHYILAGSLRLLHPFMPFITEEIWSHLPPELKDSDLLMVSKWPSH